MTVVRVLPLVGFLLAAMPVISQNRIDSFLQKVDPQKWSAAIEKKAEKIQERIVSKSLKILARLQGHEEKVYRKMLEGKDSLIAKSSIERISSKYESLRGRIKNPAMADAAKQYVPKLDSLSGALKFLDQNGIGGKVKDALAKTESLQQKFQQAEEIRRFIRERKQQLKEQLEKLGMVKELKKINKEIYYYSAQIKDYKEILKDSKKRERKALELLSKTKLFKDFMRKNSMLASLFRLPAEFGDPSSQASLVGLQTRAQVNNLIQQQIGSGGPNAMRQFRQNVNAAQAQVNQLKNKLKQYGSGSSDDIMPEGFRPNNQKTKGFWKRLEVGTNTQTQRATNYFPVTSDLGLSVGYKLNDKSIVGVGASYKLGWGRGWNHIKFTSEGAGLRTFIDWKLKGSFWMSGGYEMNYKTGFNRIYLLRDFSEWQRSGLVGISKVVDVRSKFFSKTKVQLLWDFLSYNQIPRSQSILFRIGYNF